jgi:hypothetical protein
VVLNLNVDILLVSRHNLQFLAGPNQPNKLRYCSNRDVGHRGVNIIGRRYITKSDRSYGNSECLREQLFPIMHCMKVTATVLIVLVTSECFPF